MICGFRDIEVKDYNMKMMKFILLHITFIICCALMPLSLQAQMNEVSEDELSKISAQAGINVNLGIQGNVTLGSMRISDTDHDPKHWIEFNNLGVSFDLTSPVDGDHANYNTIDIATLTDNNGQTRTVAAYQLTDHANSRNWTIGEFKFCDQPLGSITFDTSMADLANPARYVVSSHVDAGTSGVDFEYLSKYLTKDFTYTYNTNGDSLHIQGLHMSESMSGDPATPTSWAYNGQFRIGDLTGGHIESVSPSPATIDVATDTATSTTALYLNLPMKGSIRVEKVSLGASDFGPVAIDGINAHHLFIKIDPGS
jgi:hypothetical protein